MSDRAVIALIVIALVGGYLIWPRYDGNVTVDLPGAGGW